MRNREGTLTGATMHFLLFATALYFAPSIIAAARHTHNTTAVLLLNLLLGWTIVGWFVALMMALCSAPYWAYYYRRGW